MARKDIAWGANLLQNSPERSIAVTRGEVIRAWSDAASMKGLRAFYLHKGQVHP